MNEILLLNLIYFITTYITVFLIYIIFINRKRKTYIEGKKEMEMSYLINKFNLDMRKIKYNHLKWIVTFLNPLIMSVTFIIVVNIKSLILGAIIGFISMILLVYSTYEILGRTLKRKGEKTNV